MARGITLRPSSRPDRVADRSRMKFSNAMMDWYRLAKVGLLLQIGVLAFGQAQAQLAPPPPPAKINITVSNGKSLAGWRVPVGDWKLVKSAVKSPDNPKAFTLIKGNGVLINGDTGRTNLSLIHI